MGGSDNMRLSLDSFGEWDRLQRCSNELCEGLLGSTRNFVVRTIGEAQIYQDVVWIRANMIEAASEAAREARVVLKLRLADWNILQHMSPNLKVLQSLVTMQDTQFLLDCTGGWMP